MASVVLVSRGPLPPANNPQSATHYARRQRVPDVIEVNRRHGRQRVPRGPTSVAAARAGRTQTGGQSTRERVQQLGQSSNHAQAVTDSSSGGHVGTNDPVRGSGDIERVGASAYSMGQGLSRSENLPTSSDGGVVEPELISNIRRGSPELIRRCTPEMVRRSNQEITRYTAVPQCRDSPDPRGSPTELGVPEIIRHSSGSIHRLGSTEHIVNIGDQRDLLGQQNTSDISLDVVTGEQHGRRRVRTSNLSPGVTHVENSSPDNTLPDLLNSHALPPYRASRGSVTNGNASSHNIRRLQNGRTDANRRTRDRSSRSRRQRRRRSRRRSHNRRGSSGSPETQTSEQYCCTKWCCLSCLTSCTRFRWVLFSLALLGVCCVVAGIVLGALHMTGSSFLTLSLMFIGLGVMLVVVVGLGWKCTPGDHEPCHLLFGLGIYASQELDPRLRRAYRHRERGSHWYAGLLYPEFRYRRPPPSYNAAMQDYNAQLMLAHQTTRTDTQVETQTDGGLPSSPPPTYRSQASVRPGIHITFPEQSGGEFPTSRPPTYRSNISTLGSGVHQRPALDLEHDTPQTSTQTDSQNVQDGNMVDSTASSDGANATVVSVGLPMTSDDSESSLRHEVLHTTTITITSDVSEAECSSRSTDEDCNTLKSGYKIVERLDNMLDATLRSMDAGEGHSDEIVDPTAVSITVPEDTQL